MIEHTTSERRAQRQDRRLLLTTHPLLFLLLTAVSSRPMMRVGGRLVVSDPELVRRVLLDAPLDRVGEGTTGAVVFEALGVEALFSGSGSENRIQRSLLIRNMARPEPLAAYTARVAELVAAVATGEEVDAVPYLRTAAGTMTAELLGIHVEPLVLMDLVDATADAGVKLQLYRRGDVETPSRALFDAIGSSCRHSGLLAGLVDEFGEEAGGAVACVAAVAASITTLAAGTRALAWVCDASAWDDVSADPELWVNGLLRVLAPSPLMPRSLAEPWKLGDTELRAGSRLLLNTRAACRAAAETVRGSEDRSSALAFGAGAHTCPGASAARRQLFELLTNMVPLHPTVTSRRAGRGRALPRWESLTIRRRTP